MDTESAGFAEFYAAARDSCLRAVFASTGDLAAAEDLVAEAFARAWARWRTVRSHPAPAAWVVRTALHTRVSSASVPVSKTASVSQPTPTLVEAL